MLRPCLRCDRHVHPGAPCPFCGETASGSAARAVRRVSRRDFTRDAIAGTAAVLVLGCSPDEPKPPPDDTTTGGEDADDGDEVVVVQSDSDTDSDTDGDSEAAVDPRANLPADPCAPLPNTVLADVDPETAEHIRQERQNDCFVQERERNYRNRPSCTPEGICPPYGTPPIRELV